MHVSPVCLAVTVRRSAFLPHLDPATQAFTAQRDPEQPRLGVISQVTA